MSVQKKKRRRHHTKLVMQHFHTCGISSLTGSFTNFKGDPNIEGPALGLVVRGEPDELLGESGGVLPAGNIDGKELLVATFVLEEAPVALKGPPALALLSKFFTCV